MSARDAILSKVRTAIGAKADDAARRAAAEERLSGAPRGLVPARGQLPDKERVDLFCHMAESVSATVERVERQEEVPGAVSRYLRSKNLEPAVRMGGDERLKKMDWAAQTSLEIKPGRSDGQDEVGVSHALAGIAETGTLALSSGPDNPTTINFLPEHHIVVIDAGDIAGDLETVMERVRGKFGKGEMPRLLNLITGPSRSADIEQTLLLGAHGPRALHLIVVGG